MNWAAVVVAAGRGTRFGKPKQLIEIAGEPMLAWSLRTFAGMEEIATIIVVTEAEWLTHVAGVAQYVGGGAIGAVVPGGATRQASTYEGLCVVAERYDRVFVHDGARPLVRPEEVRRGMAPVRPGHGSLLAIPVVDTIKTVDSSLRVTQTLDRGSLWAAQTPQFATRTDMLAAHEAGLRDGLEATDDAMLLERIGVNVHVVAGTPENFKVTLPEDHTRADQLMRARLRTV